MTYLTLFFICLGAATLLPGGSEAYFLYKLHDEPNLAYTILLVASLGNTLGSLINYLLGKYLREYTIKKAYFKQKTIEKATKLFEKYGFIALLLSWTPIIGDPLTFVAGSLRYNWIKFLLLVFIAKIARYAFLIFFFNSVV